MTLTVGAAATTITPQRTLADYNGNPIERGPGRLMARAVVFSRDITIVVVSVDATFIDRPRVLRFRDAISRRTGIPADHVLIAATHTHNAPATSHSFLSGALPDPIYIDCLEEKIAIAVETALGNREPALVYGATIACPPIIGCRRRLSPAGQVYLPGADPDPEWPAEQAIDRDLQFLAVQRRDGAYLAVIMNVPCHNHVTLTQSTQTYDGDMFDRAGEYLRETIGDDVVVLGLPAPCGDVTWETATGAPRMDGRTGVERAHAGGRALATSINGGLQAADRWTSGEVCHITVTEQVSDRSYDESHFCYDGCRGSSPERREQIRERYDPEEAAVQLRAETTCPVELTGVTIGPYALITNPAELFSIYGKRIKAASPHETTLVSELTNGYCGYVPTPDAFAHGGYETHRTVYTSRLNKQAGDWIETHSVSLLHDLADPTTDSVNRHLQPNRSLNPNEYDV